MSRLQLCFHLLQTSNYLTLTKLSTWPTMPTTTEVTASGATLACSSAAFPARTAKSVAVWSLSFPPYAPKGVLLAPTMKTSVMHNRKVSSRNLLPSHAYQSQFKICPLLI